MEKEHENLRSVQKAGISFQTEVLEQLDDYAKKWFKGNRSKRAYLSCW